MSSVRSQLTVAVLNQITRVTQDKGNTCCPTWKEARTDAGGVDRRTHFRQWKVDTLLATLQSNALQAQLQLARNEIRSNTKRALQTFVDCLQAAVEYMIKKIKTGGSGKSAKWFDKECFHCRRLTKAKFRRYRQTKRYSHKLI